MKTNILKYFVILNLFNLSCKAQIPNNDFNDQLKNSFNAILETYVDYELEKRSHYDFDKTKLLLYIDIIEDTEIIRDSKIILDIQFWNLSSLPRDIDELYMFNGIVTYFGEIKTIYKDMFNLNPITIDTNDTMVKTNNNVTNLKDPFVWISFYFNNKAEITYISEGYDKIYYELLKNKILFDERYWSN